MEDLFDFFYFDFFIEKRIFFFLGFVVKRETKIFLGFFILSSKEIRK